MRRRYAGYGRGAALAAACSVLIASIGVRARQAPPPQQARPAVPIAASTLALHPDEHIGETVSMMATVEQVLSKTTFSVDQDKTKPTGREILVIAPSLQEAPELNAYVTVVGTVIRFDPADVASRVKDYTLDLPADAVEKFRGKPAVLATSVISAKLIDIAKRPPPPLTPEEIAFDKTMKTVQPAFGALREAIEGSNGDGAKQHAATLTNCFIEAQLFFKNRGTADATGWAQEALKLVGTIEQAAVAAKWDEARTSAASLQQMCTTCHTAHRERLDDGTFRVRGSR